MVTLTLPFSLFTLLLFTLRAPFDAGVPYQVQAGIVRYTLGYHALNPSVPTTAQLLAIEGMDVHHIYYLHFQNFLELQSLNSMHEAWLRLKNLQGNTQFRERKNCIDVNL